MVWNCSAAVFFLSCQLLADRWVTLSFVLITSTLKTVIDSALKWGSRRHGHSQSIQV
jgi:hypothetical protein